MITRDLEVRDRTGRAQHSADDGLHDNDVGLPSLMNIHLPAPAQRAHTYCCNGDCKHADHGAPQQIANQAVVKSLL